MRARALSALLAIVLWMGGAIAPNGAYARRENRFSYSFSRVWTTAVRLMRVDLGCAITEKDREEGYFFFEYKDRGKSYPGSVELIATQQDGVETVRVVVQVPALPSYVEAMMLDRLSRRLVEDFGSPREPTRKPTPEPSKKRPGAGSAESGDKPAAPDEGEAEAREYEPDEDPDEPQDPDE